MTKELLEINDEDRAEITRLISEGYTNGRLDFGNEKHITWSLDMEIWKD